MADEDWTEESLLRELETVGEAEVKIRLASKFYSDLNMKGAIAREWLQRRELARAAEQAADASRAAEAALRAADAAERSADAAERQASSADRASRIAIAALVVA